MKNTKLLLKLKAKLIQFILEIILLNAAGRLIKKNLPV